MKWLKNLFRRKPITGYRIIFVVDGKKRDMGVYSGDADYAYEQAQQKWMMEFFKSGSPEATIVSNVLYEPVREGA